MSERCPLFARNKVVSIAAETALPVLQLQHVGSEIYASVTIAADVMTLKADDTDGDTTTVLTADMGAAGYDTFGELMNAINGTASFRCFLISATPQIVAGSVSTTTLVARAITQIASGGTQAHNANGVTLMGDPAVTVAGIMMGFGISNQKFMSKPTGGYSTKLIGWENDDVCVNVLKYLSATITAVGGGDLLIYECDDANNTRSLIYTLAFTSATEATLGATVPETDHLAAPEGRRMAVTIDRATDANVISACVIVCHAETYTYGHAHIPGSNYTGSV